MGKPVITTDWSGFRETAADGGNGYLVPLRDVSELTDAMLVLVDAPDLMGNMGAAARDRVIENYGVRAIYVKVMAPMVPGDCR